MRPRLPRRRSTGMQRVPTRARIGVVGHRPETVSTARACPRIRSRWRFPGWIRPSRDASRASRCSRVAIRRSVR
jgi:hypothetical protein